MNKIILIGLLVIVFISGCGMTGTERGKLYDVLCEERGMTYDHPSFVAVCQYDCVDEDNRVHSFIREICRWNQ